MSRENGPEHINVNITRKYLKRGITMETSLNGNPLATQTFPDIQSAIYNTRLREVSSRFKEILCAMGVASTGAITAIAMLTPTGVNFPELAFNTGFGFTSALLACYGITNYFKIEERIRVLKEQRERLFKNNVLTKF